MWKYAALCLMPTIAFAGPFAELEADVFLLGEAHDNPDHHATQAEAVSEIGPRALVFEMLTPAQAEEVRDDRLDDPAGLAELLAWEDAGWPDFNMYYPIFISARGAEVYGAAVPRDETRNAMKVGLAAAFGEGAEDYGLTEELPAEQLADRLNLQYAAHCGALPTDLLPAMVDVQRLRDAVMARAVAQAFEETGGPVVVITGNGHARRDWGVPAYLERVTPGLRLYALGQSEEGVEPDGGFDLVLDAPAPEREDPCAAFE